MDNLHPSLKELVTQYNNLHIRVREGAMTREQIQQEIDALLAEDANGVTWRIDTTTGMLQSHQNGSWVDTQADLFATTTTQHVTSQYSPTQHGSTVQELDSTSILSNSPQRQPQEQPSPNALPVELQNLKDDHAVIVHSYRTGDIELREAADKVKDLEIQDAMGMQWRVEFGTGEIQAKIANAWVLTDIARFTSRY